METLKLFVDDIANASVQFNVSERTVRRWLHSSGLTKKKTGWGPKLNKAQVNEVHKLDREGLKLVEIAKIMNVSHVTISKIINGQTHIVNSKDTAIVSVIYNAS